MTFKVKRNVCTKIIMSGQQRQKDDGEFWEMSWTNVCGAQAAGQIFLTTSPLHRQPQRPGK